MTVDISPVFRLTLLEHLDATIASIAVAIAIGASIIVNVWLSKLSRDQVERHAKQTEEHAKQTRKTHLSISRERCVSIGARTTIRLLNSFSLG